MPKLWDDDADRPLDEDGVPRPFGAIDGPAHAESWHAKGYDLPAATGRFHRFRTLHRATEDDGAADGMARRFFADELARLDALGIGTDDPWRWRFERAPDRMLREGNPIHAPA